MAIGRLALPLPPGTFNDDEQRALDSVRTTRTLAADLGFVEAWFFEARHGRQERHDVPETQVAGGRMHARRAVSAVSPEAWPPTMSGR